MYCGQGREVVVIKERSIFLFEELTTLPTEPIEADPSSSRLPETCTEDEEVIASNTIAPHSVTGWMEYGMCMLIAHSGK